MLGHDHIRLMQENDHLRSVNAKLMAALEKLHIAALLADEKGNLDVDLFQTREEARIVIEQARLES